MKQGWRMTVSRHILFKINLLQGPLIVQMTLFDGLVDRRIRHFLLFDFTDARAISIRA